MVGDLLIGADGAHSRVRKYLLDPKIAALQELPLLGMTALVTLPAELARSLQSINRFYVLNVHQVRMVAFLACECEQCSHE